MNDDTRFVLDTHALWWYLVAPQRLSAAARSAFKLAETGNATLVVPAIVVAEIFFVSVKVGEPYPPDSLLDDLASSDAFEFSELGRAQLGLLARLGDVPEMHDRLIAAESVAHGAPVVTRDATLVGSPNIETLW